MEIEHIEEIRMASPEKSSVSVVEKLFVSRYDVLVFMIDLSGTCAAQGFHHHKQRGRTVNAPPYADLHNHTTASDGDLSPDALIRKAREIGVRVMGITDHDTIGGLDEALAAGRNYAVDVIPGVEVSIRFKRPFFTGTLHLLCYFAPELLKDAEFIPALTATLGQGRGEMLVKARVEEINQWFGPDGQTPILSAPLTAKQISDLSANASRRHFALALQEQHHIDDPDVVNSIIGNSSPAYLPSGIDLDMAKAFFRGFPVVSVLAHPAAGSFPGKGHYREVLPPVETVEKLLPEILDAGIKGIEVKYPGHTMEHQQLLRTWAGINGLVITGGSDCHDLINRPLGVQGLTRQEFLDFREVLDAAAKYQYP